MVKAISFLLFSFLTGSFASKYLSSNDYVGCYRDEKQRGRDLPFRPQSRTHNRGDALSCVLNCGESGFIYAGLQNGNLCFCGNKYGRFGRVPDKHCNLKCLPPVGIQRATTTDSVFNSCGGKWVNSIYSVRGIQYQDDKTYTKQGYLRNLNTEIVDEKGSGKAKENMMGRKRFDIHVIH